MKHALLSGPVDPQGRGHLVAPLVHVQRPELGHERLGVLRVRVRAGHERLHSDGGPGHPLLRGHGDVAIASVPVQFLAAFTRPRQKQQRPQEN